MLPAYERKEKKGFRFEGRDQLFNAHENVCPDMSKTRVKGYRCSKVSLVYRLAKGPDINSLDVRMKNLALFTKRKREKSFFYVVLAGGKERRRHARPVRKKKEGPASKGEKRGRAFPLQRRIFLLVIVTGVFLSFPDRRVHFGGGSSSSSKNGFFVGRRQQCIFFSLMRS